MTLNLWKKNLFNSFHNIVCLTSLKKLKTNLNSVQICLMFNVLLFKITQIAKKRIAFYQ